jgi:hypothetical protein
MNRDELLDDPEEALRLALDNAQGKIWTAIPAIVKAVDLSRQTVSAQPSIQGSITNAAGVRQYVNLPLLVDVLIVWPRAGGFALTFPIKVDDEVLIVFASRCIDSWWQSGGVGVPAEARMHDLSDGFAILAPTSQPKKLSGVSSTNVQLRNDAGSTYVEITADGKARVVSPAAIDIQAPTINLSGSVEISGPVNQSGGTFTIGGIVFGTHKHGGVAPGGSQTSGPV